MNIISKIIILVIATTLAIGGVMIYAKTKVAPPVVLNQRDQYQQDVIDLVKKINSAEDVKSEDDSFAKSIDRINIFQKEGKMVPEKVDSCLDCVTNAYTPRFIKRTFATFSQSEWKDDTHNYILTQTAMLKTLKHSDKTNVLSEDATESISKAELVINNYRDAKRISRITTFSGYDNARATISKARTYVNDQYLSNCRSLVNDLNSVKSRLATSCYNQVVAKIDQLGNYKNYSKTYYDETLVPQVDRIVTDYDNKAAAIFGTKENVNALWNRAKAHYNNAMSYYE